LTVSLGLRYELQGPWSALFIALCKFVADAPSYLNHFLPQGSQTVKGDVYLVPPGTRNNLPLEKDNFAPRIGVAYGLTPTTILRSGYGIFWVPNDVSFALNPINDMINASATTYTGTVDGTHPYNSISLPFPAAISAPPSHSLRTQGT